ncbi:MAG: hydrogenase formation protein HypD [Pseudomonadales bacterium]|nr:hydrogenase formation protein HypD [Pseudomonadales bacterium]
MRFVDEFRDPTRAHGLAAAIGRNLDRIPAGRLPLRLMEFCGGHTHTIHRYGLDRLLDGRIELVHGPGCPVCVLPRGRVDACIELALRPDVILASFGDALRVPGRRGTLLEARAAGADVRVVYSPLDALTLARRERERTVVFFALGFETTMPATALTLLEAEREGIDRFAVLCNHVTTFATLRALLEAPGPGLDGFVAPGHVTMITGTAPYAFVAEEFRRPVVVAGFEPLDLLQALAMLVAQLADGRSEVENQYRRVVAATGNAAARAAIARVFAPREAFELRGLGALPEVGVRIAERYAAFDAERRFPVTVASVDDPAELRCGDVLRGALAPAACPAFGTRCTPQQPLGALMVSSEGACAAACARHRAGP